MNEYDELQEQLRALSEEMPREAGSAVEQRLLAHFRDRRRRKFHFRAYLAAAACAALIGGLYFGSRRVQKLSPAPEERSSQTVGFIALPYAQSGVPFEQGVIVRVDIPASEFGAMGAPVIARPGQTRVKADLLVGQDGVPRAVRFVQ